MDVVGVRTDIILQRYLYVALDKRATAVVAPDADWPARLNPSSD